MAPLYNVCHSTKMRAPQCSGNYAFAWPMKRLHLITWSRFLWTNGNGKERDHLMKCKRITGPTNTYCFNRTVSLRAGSIEKHASVVPRVPPPALPPFNIMKRRHTFGNSGRFKLETAYRGWRGQRSRYLLSLQITTSSPPCSYTNELVT